MKTQLAVGESVVHESRPWDSFVDPRGEGQKGERSNFSSDHNHGGLEI